MGILGVRPSPAWDGPHRQTAFSLHPYRPVSPMRELDRTPSPSDTPACIRLAIVGRGRLGNALAEALAHGRYEIEGPLGRGADGTEAAVVPLCVPDREIAKAAEVNAPGP